MFETSSLGDAEEVVVHVARVVAGVRGWEGRGWMSASISGAMPAGWAGRAMEGGAGGDGDRDTFLSVETQERKISGTKGRGRRRGLRDTHHSMANTVAGKNGKKRLPEGVRRPARAARVYSAVTASLPRALQKVVEEDKNMNSAYQRTDFDYEADFAPDFGM